MNLKRAMCVFVLGMLPVPKISYAGQSLIAAGALDASGGDLAGKTSKPLENSVAGNLFGGLGSGLGHASGDRFIAVPDRGPNANAYNDCLDDTTSYITRFHTLRLRLVPNDGAGLPFLLKPALEETTLMSSSTPLTYGDGLAGCPNVPSCAPKLNNSHTFYFTGRSDGFGSGLSTTPATRGSIPNRFACHGTARASSCPTSMVRISIVSTARVASALAFQPSRQLCRRSPGPGWRRRDRGQQPWASRKQRHGRARHHARWFDARRHYAERSRTGWRRQ